MGYDVDRYTTCLDCGKPVGSFGWATWSSVGWATVCDPCQGKRMTGKVFITNIATPPLPTEPELEPTPNSPKEEP